MFHIRHTMPHTPTPASDEWFGVWFDSPYYHLLYRQRSQEEAADFMQHLTTVLHLQPQAHILDLACGSGRHAYALHRLGYHVTGIDLSAQSIAQARRLQNEQLHFDIHDMRQPYRAAAFDAVFNLFTSFGYFDKKSDNRATIEAIHCNLKEKGTLVIDFLNAEYVRNNLVPQETKILDNVIFYIRRYIDGDKVIKTIDIEDGTKQYHFEEKVQLLQLNDFYELLQPFFKIIHLWGNYSLTTYQAATAERLIIHAIKS
jgi:SAM-dependent methyltransferase